MKEQTIHITATEYNNTIYIVENSMDGNANESTYDKVKRLICEDLKNASKATA